MAVPTQSIDFTAASTQSTTITDANFGAFDRAKFSIYGRIKRKSTNSSGQHMIMCQQGAVGTDAAFLLSFNNDRLSFITSIDGTAVDGRLDTTQTFTSTTDWISFLVHFESANATAGNRMRMWVGVNGAPLAEVTSFNTDTNPTGSVRNSVSAVRNGNNGAGTAALDARLFNRAFFSGVLVDAATVEDNGVSLDVAGISGLWSWLDVAGGSVLSDGVLSSDWTNVNTPTASNDIPAFSKAASAGVAAASGTGNANFAGVGTSSGEAAVSGIGAATSSGVGASDGIAACSGIGEALFSGVASAAGVATVLGYALMSMPDKTFALTASNDNEVALRGSNVSTITLTASGD